MKQEGWQKVLALPGAGEGLHSFGGRRTDETEPDQLETLQRVQGKDPRVLFGLSSHGLAHRVGVAGEA